MNIARLKRLEQILRKVGAKPSPHREFSMNSWFEILIDDVRKPKFKVSATGACVVIPVKHECGTSACALGHAALDPTFQKAGLRMKFHGESGTPIYKGHSGFNAGAKFFGITDGQSSFLFGGFNRTASEVAYRVKEVYSGRVPL